MAINNDLRPRTTNVGPASQTTSTSTTTSTAPTQATAQATSTPTTAELHQTHFAGVSRAAERTPVTTGQTPKAGSTDGFAALNDAPVDDKATSGSAFGFAWLMRPFKKDPPVKSSVALQIQQKGGLNDADSVRHAVSGALARVKSNGGAPAVGQLVQTVNKAAAQAEKAQHLVDDAGAHTAALKEQVGWDARLGRVVDWLWFGIPDAHRAFHDSKKDLKASAEFASDLTRAVGDARAEARGAVKALLVGESPAFASLARDHNDAGMRLDVANQLGSLAERAQTELSSASHYVMMRNMTSQTVTEPVYETRVTHNQDGTTSSEQVQTGTQDVPNPTWQQYHSLALMAKSSAEGALRELNGVAGVARKLFPDHELNGVDGGLIGVLDYIGQPSFGFWSYDSSQISSAESSVRDLGGAAGRLSAKLEPPFRALDQQLNAQIDTRWQALS